MMESETIAEYSTKICDIANKAFALGKKYSETNLVTKVLNSLPKRFAYKVQLKKPEM